MFSFNKNWIAATFLGLGTLSFGIVVLLTGMLFRQNSVQIPQAATPACTVTFSIQVTPTEGPSPTPIPIAQCVNLKVYLINGATWTPITDITTVKPGNTVTFAVIGATTGGIIDRARFEINGQPWVESTQVNPFGEYYYQYTFPLTTSSYRINAQVHHVTLGWIQ